MKRLGPTKRQREAATRSGNTNGNRSGKKKREQGAGSGEQGAGSGEREAGSGERGEKASHSLPFLASCFPFLVLQSPNS